MGRWPSKLFILSSLRSIYSIFTEVLNDNNQRLIYAQTFRTSGGSSQTRGIRIKNASFNSVGVPRTDPILYLNIQVRSTRGIFGIRSAAPPTVPAESLRVGSPPVTGKAPIAMGASAQANYPKAVNMQ